MKIGQAPKFENFAVYVCSRCVAKNVYQCGTLFIFGQFKCLFYILSQVVKTYLRRTYQGQESLGFIVLRHLFRSRSPNVFVTSTILGFRD